MTAGALAGQDGPPDRLRHVGIGHLHLAQLLQVFLVRVLGHVGEDLREHGRGDALLDHLDDDLAYPALGLVHVHDGHDLADGDAVRGGPGLRHVADEAELRGWVLGELVVDAAAEGLHLLARILLEHSLLLAREPPDIVLAHGPVHGEEVLVGGEVFRHLTPCDQARELHLHAAVACLSQPHTVEGVREIVRNDHRYAVLVAPDGYLPFGRLDALLFFLDLLHRNPPPIQLACHHEG